MVDGRPKQQPKISNAMNYELTETLLKNFFSAYFHEDFLREAEDPAAVVRAYARTVGAGEAQALAAAILRYRERLADDQELERRLFAHLGCYYSPSADGLSAGFWLQKVAEQLTHDVNNES
jgi:hypothetical protein